MIEFLVVVIFAFLALIPFSLTIWLLVYAASSATSCVGQCRSCRYDLRHLGDRHACPECGHPFHINANGDIISR